MATEQDTMMPYDMLWTNYQQERDDHQRTTVKLARINERAKEVQNILKKESPSLPYTLSVALSKLLEGC